MVNVKRSICECKGCDARASFNHPGTKGYRLCGTHKLTGMVNNFK
jgi:hypothetical protein